MNFRQLTRGIHWQAPTIIVSAFISGLVFGIGHDVFYNYLDGKQVNDRLFDQQINLAVGQAFAFLVRAALVIAVCASYWQVFWRTVFHDTLALSQIDALAGMLGSALDLFNLKALARHPALVALALLSWMVPLASILPPATLSVAVTTREEHDYSHVPVPQFVDTAMATSSDEYVPADLLPEGMFDDDGGAMSTRYHKPSRQLSRLVTSTAFSGTVPDHQTTRPNSTYVLSFPGPALNCQSISPDLLQDFSDVMNCSFPSNGSATKSKAECYLSVSYLSWVPGKMLDDDYQEHYIPFVLNAMVDGVLPLEPLTGFDGRYRDPRYIGGMFGEAASAYIATKSRKTPYNPQEWDLLNCSMYNGSYVVNVKSDSNSRGVLSRPDIRTSNSVPFDIDMTPRHWGTPLPSNESVLLSYLAFMESLNRLLIETIVGLPDARIENTCYWKEESLTVQNEGLTQTLLLFTNELLRFLSKTNWLVRYLEQDPRPLDVEQWTLVEKINENMTVSYPNEAFAASTFKRSLGSVVEELFHNMTLSLFSNPLFLGDTTEVVEIKYNITQNTYSYNSKNLFISYGLAVGLSLIASIAGCISIYCAGASYSNRFSTVLRTTRGQSLEELVALNDRRGNDPLPKYLAKSRVNLQSGQSALESDDDAQQLAGQPDGGISEQSVMLDVLQSEEPSAASLRQRHDSLSLNGMSVSVENGQGQSSGVRQGEERQ